MQETGTKGLQGERLWTATFILLLMANLFSNMVGNGLQNGIAILVEAAHAPATLTGIISAAFSLTALVVRLFSGDLSDRQGRKRILLWGSLFMALGCVLSIFCTNLNLLIGTRILMGIGFGLVGTTVSAAAADIIPPARLGEGMGYQGLSMALAMAVGPSISIYLAIKGQVPLFAVYAVLMVGAVFVVLACKLKKPEHSEHLQDKEVEKETGNAATRFLFRFLEKKALAPAFVVTLSSFTMALLMIYISLFAVTNNIEGASLYFIVGAATMVLFRVFGSKAFDRFSPNTLLIPSFVMGILGILGMMIFRNTPSLLFAGLCFGVLDSVNVSVLMSESLRYVPENRHGAASATFIIGCDIGMGLGSLLWGVVIDAWGFTGVFIGGIIFMVAASVASLILLRKDRARG